MGLPTPPHTIAALAAFVRDRLAEVSGSARQFATVVVGAAAPFAPTSYARARLIRQMHASGLLTADEARRTAVVLELDSRPAVDDGMDGDPRSGAPR